MVRRLFGRLPPIGREFVRFGLVGVTNLVLFFGLFNVGLSLSWPPPLAYAVAFLVSSLNSYALNRAWTFRSAPRGPIGRQYALFLVLTTVGLGLNEIAFIALSGPLDDLGRLGHNLAAVGAIPISTAWNFLANRRWTFGVNRGAVVVTPAATGATQQRG